MSRILPISHPQNETAITLTAIRQKLGMVPNLYATIAHSSKVLNAYLAFNQTLSEGRLTAKQRELIALAVGQANHCQYCLSAHTLLAENLGLNKDQILLAREGKADESLDQTIIQFAIQVIDQQGVLSDEQFNFARENGLEDELVFEVLAQITANIFTNYSNHIAQTSIDFPVVSLSNQP
ncbi:carboxymuconolactone decarboxylase family protein [Vibrio sp. HDW18]|uniref:carboxymuconolactone decarboxylase family protein n=1 Tax=Vibrio sp. HDW18 TaxID=2714948 RepID=UPI00140E0733|nr:carboxymuconolactone decarboxylase family protein [Vibrio sp. HDW18]QIL86327.1 carboxymuconolactone decarboxylase family protein [Vibrio sp. HDW18]